MKCRKIVSLLLLLAVVLTCVPAVHAAGEKTYCAYGHTSHAGITCDAELITWSEWTETSSLPTSGSYYLTEDVTITATSKPSDLNLDLNGCDVTRLIEVGDTDDCNVFSVVKEKSFLLTDTNDERHGIVSVTWEEGAETANAKKLGKVVKISANAIMKLYGGIIDGSNITGNTNTAANATLNVENGTDANDAALYMYGGKVIGIQNYTVSSSGTKTYYDGSAIITRSGTTLRIYGGEVVGGTCKRGACLHANSDDTQVLGGTFVGGTVSSSAAGIYISSKKITIGDIVSDGGIYLSSDATKLTLTGAPQIGGTCSSGYGICFGASATGTVNATGLSKDARINIKNNRSDLTAPILTVDEDLSGCFTFWNTNYRAKYDAEAQTISMEYYIPTDNTVCVCRDCKGETIPQWSAWDGTATAGHYYLDEDTELTEAITFAPATDATMVLNLNGNTISKTTAGPMFLLQGKANLVIMDGSSDASGAMVGTDRLILTETADASAEVYGGNFSLSNPTTQANTGALVYAAAGSVKLAGGEFFGAAAQKGGTVAVADGAALEVSGGTFHAGTADQGDTLYAAPGSTLTIKGNAYLAGGVEIDENVTAAISETPLIRKDKDGSAYSLKTASPLKVGVLSVGARIMVTGTEEILLASEFVDTNAFDAKFYFTADSANMRIKEVDGTIKLVPMVIDAAVTQARRDQVEAYMRAQATLLWKATEDITYCTSREGVDDPTAAPASQQIHIKAGRTYMGLPYAYSATSMISFLDYAGEPDELNIYPISGLTYQVLSGLSTQTRMGNDCSSSVATAWSQIGASVYASTSAGYVPRYGIVNVGDYIPEESYGTTGTAVVVENNGKDVMYESYAKLQKADAVVRYKSANNHTMMVVSVNVVRNSDGSINPTSSYIIVLEQTSSNVRNEKTKTVDGVGTVYEIYGVDKKYTFQYLFNNTYIPVTCMELLDAAPVDAPMVEDSIETPTAENLFEGTITSNYHIDCVTITITDEDGNVVQKAAQNAYRGRREFIMPEFITGQPKNWSRGIVDLDALPEGQYHCDVVCRLSTGQTFTVRQFDIGETTVSEAVVNTATGNTYATMTEALTESADGAELRLLASVAENVTIGKNITLDLNGCTIIGITATDGAKVTLKDSSTDDYSAEDGYGKITGSVSGIEAAKGYMMITENGETSFHRLNLDTVGVNIRASAAGLYFSSQFGGDEVVKGNIVAYGTAMGAGKLPDFADKTYTRFAAENWKPGCDADGNSNNLANGTLLQGIMSKENGYSTNKHYADMKIYSQAYVELADGTRILGDAVCYSLHDIFEGTDTITGIDQSWNTLTDAQKQPVLQMYDQFQNVMNGWNIPNIKAAAAQ